jgi:nucleotide-binding universal stress UspA family protein
VAAAFKARLTGIAFVYEPTIPAMIDMYGIPADVIESQRAESEKAAKAAVGRLDEAAGDAGIAMEAHMHNAAVATAPRVFAGLARRFDLSIVGQSEPDQQAIGNLIIEAALFDTGRPVLVVPYIQRAGLRLDRILLCWDGSRSAARAAADALPFLRRAKLVEVVTVASEPAKSDEMPGADIAQHLARHGVTVELKRIVTAETDVASTILSHAADSSADFLVMGGYGHSRLREFILGGVTREILASMTVPVLMSH